MKGLCVMMLLLIGATSIAASQARAQQQQISTGCAQIVAVLDESGGGLSAEEVAKKTNTDGLKNSGTGRSADSDDTGSRFRQFRATSRTTRRWSPFPLGRQKQGRSQPLAQTSLWPVRSRGVLKGRKRRN